MQHGLTPLRYTGYTCCNFSASSARLSGAAAGTSGFKALCASKIAFHQCSSDEKRTFLLIKWFMPPHNSIWCALRQTTPLLFADTPMKTQCHLLSRQHDFLPEKMNDALAQNSNDTMRMSRMHSAPRHDRP